MRRMTYTDIYAIRRIEKDEFTEIYSFADYLKFLVYYPLLCLVIDVDGELAAFIIGMFVNASCCLNWYCYLH